jgi:hypothetical protein
MVLLAGDQECERSSFRPDVLHQLLRCWVEVPKIRLDVKLPRVTAHGLRSCDLFDVA